MSTDAELHLFCCPQRNGAWGGASRLSATALASAVVLAGTVDLPSQEAHAQPAYEARTGSDNPLEALGFNDFSRPSLIDVDGDGDLDVIVSEGDNDPKRSDNTGTAASPSFSTAWDISLVTDSDAHLTFADLDGDGDLDVWDLHASTYIAQWENVGSATTLDLSGTSIQSYSDDLEGAASGDLDGDGDDDLVVGYSEGGDGYLAYFENTGSPTSPTLTRRTGTDNPFDGITVAAADPTPEAADIDGDGDLDLVVGKEEGTFAYVENTGSATSPVFELRSGTDNPFDGLNIGDNSAPALGDVDGDGDLDLVSGEYAGDGSTAQLFYFENTGDLTRTVQFSEATDDPLSDVGLSGNASPILADLDSDGDDDVIMGQSDGTLAYFVNTGDAETPSFVEQTGVANPFDGFDVGDNSAPALGDIDGDGDLDLVVGGSNGTLTYFENTGSITSPSFTERSGTDNPFDGFDVGDESRPAIADVDGDGDLDVVAGNADGFFVYFENTGDVISPSFTQETGSTNPLNGFDVGSNAAPRFSDLDSDGDLDAIAGRSDGTLAFFENTGSISSANFTERTGSDHPLSDVGLSGESVPAFSDLDSDGDPDMVVGTQDGTVETYQFGTSDVLPVELTDFVGRPDGNGIVLTWSTASEDGNAGFEVHHLLGEESGMYDVMGFVDGAGTTSQPQSYRFRTDDLAPGTHRFRLKQIDVDGSSEYSRTVSVKVRIASRYRLQAPSPNPTSGSARMRLTVETGQEVHVEVFDMLGRRVAVPHRGPLSGQEQETFTVGEDLQAGTYLVRITGEVFEATERLVIVP